MVVKTPMIQSALGTVATPQSIAGVTPDFRLQVEGLTAEQYRAKLWDRFKRDPYLMDVYGEKCGTNVVVEGGTRGHVKVLLRAIDYCWEVRYDSF